LGKKNLKKILEAQKRALGLVFLALSVAATGCKTDYGEYLQSGRVLAINGLQGRWVGPVAPAGTGCGGTTQGLMTIGEHGFGLDPFQSTTVIKGDVRDDGHLSGRLVRQGAEHQEIAISFEGMVSAQDTISGTLQSGRCRWTVTLHRG
jgi:hypothetical protein